MISEIEESVQATPTLLKGEDVETRGSVQAAFTPLKGTRPKVLICGKWRKVPDSYPKDASGRLEHDQPFINDLAKQPLVEFRVACQLNTNRGAKPKSMDTKSDLIYNRAFGNYL